MRWLIALVLAVSSSFAQADGPVYGELQLGAAGLSNDDLDFYPGFGGINAGFYVLPNIGLEVFADTAVQADSKGGFEMEIEQAYGIGVRFQSPPTRGTQGYIVLGAVNYTLDQQSVNALNQAQTAINEDFTGARISIGLMQRLKRAPYLQVSAEYRHYNADEPLRVDAFVLGLRVNAR